MKQMLEKWKSPSVNADPSSNFITSELIEAIRQTKSGKTPGLDLIHMEFILHAGKVTITWLQEFYSVCIRRLRIPKIWRRAVNIAIPKLNKSINDPKSYRPISLLCVPFKILERIIHTRLEPIINPQLPSEQAGFHHGRSIVDQVTLMTQDIEDSFQSKHKTGAVFLDLTAVYETCVGLPWLNSLN